MAKFDDAHPGLSAHRGDKGQAEATAISDEQMPSDLRIGTGIEPVLHARSPVFSPNRPEGLNISTTISTTKAKMS
jgi:hypothetical protein